MLTEMKLIAMVTQPVSGEIDTQVLVSHTLVPQC